MKISFLNVDLKIESADDLQILVDELKKDCFVHFHGKNNFFNNFAVFSHHSAFDSYEINSIINLFCDLIERFPNGNSDVLKGVVEVGAHIAITIYPEND